jgi:hypothetical protein
MGKGAVQHPRNRNLVERGGADADQLDRPA